MNTAVATREPRSSKRIRTIKWIGGMAAGVLLLLAAFIGYTVWSMSYVPADLDYATTRLTENGLYQVSYEASQTPITINQLHTWTLTVTTSEGQPVENATIAIDGDMPQHGHGLPTQPQVTRYLGEGRYLVEGVKFQMGGWWVMDFTITAKGQIDTVRFNFILK